MTARRLISVIVFCIYIAAVAYLCFAKPDELPQMPQFWFGLPADKVGHFLMFMPFPILAYMVFGKLEAKTAVQAATLATILAIGLGLAVGTEHLQAILAYRTAEFKDLYADAAGILTGEICLAVYLATGKRI